MNYTAVIIDDEEASIVSISLIIKDFCPHVSVVGSAKSANEGIDIIREQNPDIVFLDIEMPHMNGFDMLNNLPEKNFELIFITAYNQYAIDAFKVNAIDYLLKPIDIPDLIKAIERVRERKGQENYKGPDYSKLLNSISGQNHRKVAIHNIDGIDYVDPERIIYLRADGAYTHIFTQDGKLTSAKKLKEFVELPALTGFFRVHNSFVINLIHVKKYNRKEGQILLSNGHNATVSRRNKNNFLQAMEEFTK